MPFSDDIMKFLGTSDKFASVRQMEDLRNYGNKSIPTSTPSISGRAQLAGELLHALSGRMALNQSYNMESGANKAMLESAAPAMGARTSSMNAPIAPTKTATLTPASIRNNNPGAQWPNDVSAKFGSTSFETLNDGQKNKIATFTNPIDGAAAMFGSLAAKYSGKPISEAIASWSGHNNVGAYLSNLTNAGIDTNQPITPEFLASPQGIQLAKTMAKHEAGREFPLADQDWAQAQAKVFGGGAPAQGVAPGAIPPGAVAAQASADGAPVAPPMGVGGPPSQVASADSSVPIPNQPITANAPAPQMPQQSPQQMPDQAPSQQTAQVDQPIASMNQSFETKFPTPPPPNYGFTPEQMNNFALMNPEIANKVWENRVQQYTPQYMDIEGGKRWIVPATRETGFIPVPRYGKADIGDLKLETVQRMGPDGKVGSEFLVPGGGKGNGLNDLNNTVEWDRAQKAETGSRVETAKANAKSVSDDISNAVDQGNSSSKTLQIVGILEDLNKLPDTKDIHTGPWAERMLNVDKILKDILPGSPTLFNPGETVGKAEVLQKLGVQLSAAMAKELTNRPTQWDFQTFIGNNPSLFLTPEGRHTLTDLARQVATFNKKLGQAGLEIQSSDPTASKNWYGIKKKLYEENPIHLHYNGQVVGSEDEAEKLLKGGTSGTPSGPIPKFTREKGLVRPK